MAEMTCTKCSGTMVAGFIPDHSYGAIMRTNWYEGPPNKSFLGNLKLRGQPFLITTYRCSACGFLESYAQPK